MTPFLLANFVDASDKKLYERRIYIDLGIKDFASSLCWIIQHYPVKFDIMHGFECQTDLTNVTALKGHIDSCISGTAAEKMGYTTEGMMDMLHIYHNFIVQKPRAYVPSFFRSKLKGPQLIDNLLTTDSPIHPTTK